MVVVVVALALAAVATPFSYIRLPRSAHMDRTLV